MGDGGFLIAFPDRVVLVKLELLFMLPIRSPEREVKE